MIASGIVAAISVDEVERVLAGDIAAEDAYDRLACEYNLENRLPLALGAADPGAFGRVRGGRS
ncbi:hypothetical protein [Bosea sp. (in: a-proteobacteria)]|jgi:hypothetical protein|uniref:hypothetical protein n=1 Tax=Bosea sp. (in: a-proteobacteria) TaxID=1871050 RepID=UPI003569801D